MSRWSKEFKMSGRRDKKRRTVKERKSTKGRLSLRFIKVYLYWDISFDEFRHCTGTRVHNQ